jgi:hypothetical protein
MEEQLLQFGARVVGAHEGFAHKEAVNAMLHHFFHIGTRENAALGDDGGTASGMASKAGS